MKRTLDNPTSASNACPTSQIRGIFEIADNATSASNACPCKIHFRRISLSSLTHSPPHPQAFPCLLNMNNFDLRLCVPFLINSLKSLVALPGNDDWDPFYAIHHLTWIKLCLFLLILALFSFTSINIEVPYTASVPTSSASCVRLRLGVFSLPITLSFMASVFFPQTLFWYTYPILVLAPFGLLGSSIFYCGYEPWPLPFRFMTSSSSKSVEAVNDKLQVWKPTSHIFNKRSRVQKTKIWKLIL